MPGKFYKDYSNNKEYLLWVGFNGEYGISTLQNGDNWIAQSVKEYKVIAMV